MDLATILGGAGLLGTLGAVIWALIERNRNAPLKLTAALATNRAELAEDRAERAEGDAVARKAELAAYGEAVRLESDTREAVVATQRLRIAGLEREVEKYEASDPASAGKHLARVLAPGDGK